MKVRRVRPRRLTRALAAGFFGLLTLPGVATISPRPVEAKPLERTISNRDITRYGLNHIRDPIKGRNIVTDHWGAPRPGRTHKGVDLRARVGRRLYAAADGVVSRRRFEAGGAGHYLQIIHGKEQDGVQVRKKRIRSEYFHLSKYAPNMKRGTQVQRGQLIGYAGTSGGVPPHLHFGIAVEEGPGDWRRINPRAAGLNYWTKSADYFTEPRKPTKRVKLDEPSRRRVPDEPAITRGEFETYIVEDKYDTLSWIAYISRDSEEAIAKRNDIEDPNRIRRGQQLRIRRIPRHTVVAGDTVSDLLKRYDMTPDFFETANGRLTDSTIYTGETLIVGKERSTAPTNQWWQSLSEYDIPARVMNAVDDLNELVEGVNEHLRSGFSTLVEAAQNALNGKTCNHTMRRGETLSGVARRNNLPQTPATYKRLARMNPTTIREVQTRRGTDYRANHGAVIKIPCN
ncbi:MAG: peptidoglycan DD-metalloendopeptidase family protein [Candidatus Woesearchaeota archaeon]|nr:peptidoglycan DD-metalloendopeptidase family protein [Candidatus Woesearchaeota archaeon]